MILKTPIIPKDVTTLKTMADGDLDLKAICVFTAIGFFLDTDTYWTHNKVPAPASDHEVDEKGYLVKSKPYFQWHYTPRAIAFNQALGEFTDLFEQILQDQLKDQQVILPLSGGLDSRTQAAALHYLGKEVNTYSYAFENGYKETDIGQTIAKTCGFPFQKWIIPKGYLWGVLDDLAQINGCQSDFTSPRQMAVSDRLKGMGEVLSLGHWGDVLFDNYGLPHLKAEEEVQFLKTKVLKRGGLDLAKELWRHWELEGEFEDYFTERLRTLLKTIDIEDTNTKLRAFKSKYWAPRWTSVNLAIFERLHPIELPYYDDRMCQWICTIPEAHLAKRQLQIAYIKKRNPKLAKITWQDHRPFNLNTYQWNTVPYNLPYRTAQKIKRTLQAASGKAYIQRNWELQLQGEVNKQHILAVLKRSGLKDWVGSALLDAYVTQFYGAQPLDYAHGLNMLLVLAKFKEMHCHG